MRAKTKKILNIGGLLVAGIVVGLALAGASASLLHYTSSNAFCVSCHEMTWPQQTYQQQSHFENVSGVRAGCGDCHIPHHPWPVMIWEKTKAGTRDIFYHLTGKIDTLEKYQAHRAEMAQRVWADFKAHDSRTCHNCHAPEAWALDQQSASAKIMHQQALGGQMTCIDCHKGVGHGITPQQISGS